ncbi:stage III sporulation protein AF [Bacillus sp. DJP31]|uniref:stage III sporulation protein AF n=1 Tax=Bacillus sp. DJP31 TaxID=3409789 RepID=UPI003BB4F40F
MEFLTGWITNIIMFILLATIVDMLLPNSSLQRYAKMVTGLLLIVIILTPILKMFHYDFEEILAAAIPNKTTEEKNIENLIEFKKKEIQASTRAYILEETSNKMKEEVEDEVMKRFNKKVSNLSIEVDENIEVSADSSEHFSVIVQLSEQTEEEDGAIPVVAEVNIDTKKPSEKKSTSFDDKEIVSYLAKEWELNTDQIIVALEGGRAN